ncbi:SCND3 protein, partial [Polyodon spathula]|nr:SCND3 protein [Polyodon spathula]
YNTSYIKFGFISSGDAEAPKPQCVICGEVLSNDAMKPFKLIQHLKTKDAELEFFERKCDELKGQQQLKPFSIGLLSKFSCLPTRSFIIHPEYLSNLLTRYVPACKLRSSESDLLVIPKQKCATLRECSFSFMAPTPSFSTCDSHIKSNQLSRPTCSLLLSMFFKPAICYYRLNCYLRFFTPSYLYDSV